MYAHAVPIVLTSDEGDPIQRGFHLLWLGPPSWLFCLNGWRLFRRDAFVESSFDCQELSPANLLDLVRDQELELPPLGSLSYGLADRSGWEVITFEPDTAADLLRVRVGAIQALAYGMRDGKIVAATKIQAGDWEETLSAVQMDRLVIYAQGIRELKLCRGRWVSGAPFLPLVTKDDFRLPTDRFAPFGDGFNQLFARQALGQFPEEGDLTLADYEKQLEPMLDGILDELLKQRIRPLDLVLLRRLQEDPDRLDELTALDPIRILYLLSAWRRGLGLAWFDDASTGGLIEGQYYQYRIEGDFPTQDLEDEIWSFATVPSGSLLPVQFAIGRVNFLLRRPTPIELWPSPLDADPGRTKTVLVARRGLRLLRSHPDDDKFILPWERFSPVLTLDLPQPALKGGELVLELADEAGRDLTYEWLDREGVVLQSGVVAPSGLIPVGVDEGIRLNLYGDGFLFAVRRRGRSIRPDSLTTLAVETVPLHFSHTEPPEAPRFAELTNLQQKANGPVGYTLENGRARIETKDELGFRVRWLPPTQVEPWPIEVEAVPPVESLFYRLEHLASQKDGTPLPGRDWEAILGKDSWPDRNWIHGERNLDARPLALHPGVDLLSLFPESYRAPLGNNPWLSWKDLFDLPSKEKDLKPRPLPPLGSFHQYRVASVDLLGRSSRDWRLTNLMRLEKHVPPPVPVSPNPLGDPATPPAPSAPSGVRARVWVRDTPGLSQDELDLLDAKGAINNLIELSWGWFDQQRGIDPYAKTFRLYVSSPPPNLLRGSIDAVDPLPDLIEDSVVYKRYRLSVTPALATMQKWPANSIRGTYLNAEDPFYIDSHGELQHGAPGEILVSTGIRRADGSYAVPRSIPFELAVAPSAAMGRPESWSERIAMLEPIQAGVDHYKYYFKDRLDLRADHPSDEVWVGVSAADAEPYVIDFFGRGGNESPIAGVSCRGRWRGRPRFEVPVPLAEVPRLGAPEPGSRPVEFELNLRPYLSYLDGLGGDRLGATDFIMPERLDGESLVDAYSVVEGDIIPLAVEDYTPKPDGPSLAPILVPNPTDKAEMVKALESGGLGALADHYLVFLAGSHPHRDQLFQPILERAIPFGPFRESLSNKSTRYVYRVRKSQAGHLSAGSAMAQVVVRVPSRFSGAIPRRTASLPTDPAGSLRLSLRPSPDVGRLLIYACETVPITQPFAQETEPLLQPSLLRRIDQPDFIPQLKTPEGEIISATVIQLSDPLVQANPDEASLEFVFTPSGAPGARVRIWAASLTDDGIPSPLGGGWQVQLSSPFVAPALSLDDTANPLLRFGWDLTDSGAIEVALERSPAEILSWTRIAPLYGADSTGCELTQPPGRFRYRLRVFAPDGRSAEGPPSSTITV